METLYHQTNCMIQDVQNAFQKLEQSEPNSNENDQSDLSNYIDMRIQQAHKYNGLLHSFISSYNYDLSFL